MSPTLSPTLFPTLYPTLFPTQYPTLIPTDAPNSPPPTDEPTASPVGVPVVPNVVATVASGDTTVIFVLDGASPGVPHPNELTVTDIVVQGVPASPVMEGESAEDGAPGVCEVGPDGRSVQYVGSNYVGAYRCSFEVTDDRGIIVISDLDLEVTVFEAPAAGELPTESEPKPEPMPEPATRPPKP